MKIMLLLIFALLNPLFAENNPANTNNTPSGEWPLLFDDHFGEFFGANLMLSANNAVFWSEDKIIDLSGLSLSQPWSGILRGLELALITLPINDIFFLLQHEAFGHGARAREFGFKTPLPQLNSLPLPYGPGIASQEAIGLEHATKLETLMFTIGGVEAANVLAENMNDRWWRLKQMNAKSAFMNILASHNTEGYLWLFRGCFKSVQT